VSINYNKLHADPKQGKTLDIGMKCSLLFLFRIIKWCKTIVLHSFFKCKVHNASVNFLYDFDYLLNFSVILICKKFSHSVYIPYIIFICDNGTVLQC